MTQGLYCADEDAGVTPGWAYSVFFRQRGTERWRTPTSDEVSFRYSGSEAYPLETQSFCSPDMGGAPDWAMRDHESARLVPHWLASYTLVRAWPRAIGQVGRGLLECQASTKKGGKALDVLSRPHG